MLQTPVKPQPGEQFSFSLRPDTLFSCACQRSLLLHWSSTTYRGLPLVAPPPFGKGRLTAPLGSGPCGNWVPAFSLAALGRGPLLLPRHARFRWSLARPSWRRNAGLLAPWPGGRTLALAQRWPPGRRRYKYHASLANTSCLLESYTGPSLHRKECSAMMGVRTDIRFYRVVRERVSK
jgi:hypothetical protein